jgi:hypothetical protein
MAKIIKLTENDLKNMVQNILEQPSILKPTSSDRTGFTPPANKQKGNTQPPKQKGFDPKLASKLIIKGSDGKEKVIKLFPNHFPVLTKILSMVGLTPTTVSPIENGLSLVSMDKLVSINCPNTKKGYVVNKFGGFSTRELREWCQMEWDPTYIAKNKSIVELPKDIYGMVPSVEVGNVVDTKKVVKLTESDLVKLVNKVLNEQPDFVSDADVIRYIEERMNVEILPNKQTEILNTLTIRVEQGSDGTYSVVIKGMENGEVIEGKIPLENVKEYFYVGEFDGQFKIGTVSTAFAIDILKEDPKLQMFFEKNPRYLSEIERGVVDVTISTNRQTGGRFQLSFTGKPDKDRAKSSVTAGSEYPLGTYFKNNMLPMKVNKDVYADLQSGGLTLQLEKFFFMTNPNLNRQGEVPRTATTTGKTPSETTIKIQFSLVDVFKFDETNFIDEGKSMGQIDAFVDKMKTNINQFGKPLTDHIMKSSPKIVGYASIDANSEQKITGKYAPCKSVATRGEYNKCLSEARAKRIADIINEKLTGTGLSFGFYGAGETTKFGPGWTAQAPTKVEDTAPNRRFELTPIPPFSKTIKGQ